MRIWFKVKQSTNLKGCRALESHTRTDKLGLTYRRADSGWFWHRVEHIVGRRVNNKTWQPRNNRINSEYPIICYRETKKIRNQETGVKKQNLLKSQHFVPYIPKYLEKPF